MQDDIGAGFAALTPFQGEVGGAIAAPAHRLGIGPGRERDQLHLVGHHEAGIEAQAEVADDGIILAFIFLQEFLGAGEGHLVDVALHLIGRHADAVVADRDRFGFAINADADLSFFALAAIAAHGRHAPLADGVDAITDQLAQEHLMAGIDGLFNDRKNIFRVDLDLALFLHSHGQWTTGGTLGKGWRQLKRGQGGVPEPRPGGWSRAE